jgi:hypothetical protein
MVARLPRLLSGLPDALSQQQEARASIALALEEFQAMNLALRGPMAPFQPEPGFDGDEVVLQAPREAGQLRVLTTVDRKPPLSSHDLYFQWVPDWL